MSTILEQKIKTVTETAQVRLLIQGPPKSGKTWSANTFPNPLFFDFDHGLESIKGAKFLPFYDMAFTKELGEVAKCNAFVKLLNSPDVAKLTLKDTIVIDSLSTLADAVSVHLTNITPVSSKSREPDTFWYWKSWAIWFRDFCTKLSELTCNVVVIAHESEIRDLETGRLLSYKWMLQGQEFSPRLAQFFTDVVRQTVVTTDAGNGKVKKVYQWQIQPDSTLPSLCTRSGRLEKFIEANYKNLYA